VNERPAYRYLEPEPSAAARGISWALPVGLAVWLLILTAGFLVAHGVSP
jgi:hypothetical protein